MITTSRYKVVAGELSGVRRVDQGGLIVDSHEPTQREGTRTPAPFHTHGYTRHLSHSLARSLALGPWETRGAVYGGRKSEKGWTGGSGSLVAGDGGFVSVSRRFPPPLQSAPRWKLEEGGSEGERGGLLSTNLFPYPITRPSRNIPNRARVGKEHKSHGELPAPAVEGGERRE